MNFLANYNAHLAGYALSVVYLVLFVGLWKYVTTR